MTIECVIAQKFHRSIMGPKGSRIQQITRDHNVQIKFPEREDPQGKRRINVKTISVLDALHTCEHLKRRKKTKLKDKASLPLAFICTSRHLSCVHKDVN